MKYGAKKDIDSQSRTEAELEVYIWHHGLENPNLK